MKFTSYRYWMNEKFEEDSDPIDDLGIGIPFKKIKIGDIIKPKNKNIWIKNSDTMIFEKPNEYSPDNLKFRSFPMDVCSFVENVEKNNDIIKIVIVPFGGFAGAVICRNEYFTNKISYDVHHYGKWKGKTDLLTWDKHFEIVKENS